ncbi:hypothetical protein MRX96_030737 [Rhipicephalus microplus]
MTPGAPNGGQKSGKDAERTVPRKVPTGKARTDFRERASGSYGGLPPRRSMPARRRQPPGRRATPTRSAAGARGAAASNPAWRLWVIPNGPEIRAPPLAALNAPTEPPALPGSLANVRRDPALRAGYETPPTPRPAPGIAPPSIVSCGQQRRRRAHAHMCKNMQV